MKSAIGIRESYCRFPNWSQHFWTWLTGKALPNQKPLIVHRWWSYLAVTLTVFFSGIVLSATAYSFKPAHWQWLVAAGWILTVNGARTMFLVILHQCVHRQFSEIRWLDKCIGDIVSILVINQNQNSFRDEHIVTHHSRAKFATMQDPPAERMVRIGIRPGMPKSALWRRSLWVLVSPFFHVETFMTRVKSNLVYHDLFRFCVLVTFVSALAIAHMLIPDGLAVMVVAYWIPIIFFVQMSALLVHLGEHAWLVPVDNSLPPRYYHATRTWARFNGCRVPDKGLPLKSAIWGWLKWAAATCFYHLPDRLLVVVGDLPNHDFHHRFPASKEWMCAAYARQRDIDTNPNSYPPYLEFWGIGEAIDHVLEGLSSAPDTGCSTEQIAV
jgi:fatty acid desaturase